MAHYLDISLNDFMKESKQYKYSQNAYWAKINNWVVKWNSCELSILLIILRLKDVNK